MLLRARSKVSAKRRDPRDALPIHHADHRLPSTIHDGDMVVVDRPITPKHRHIVLAVVNQEYTVKRLYRRAGVIELRPENPAYHPILFGDDETLEVWGLVVGTLCRFDA